MTANIYVGWIAIAAGLVFDAALGLFFHPDEWLGGYGSWRRRMLRLTYVAMVGTGLLHVAAALSSRLYCSETAFEPGSWLLIAGAVTMPAVCLLAAWRKWLRHLFFVPVLCLIAGVLDFIVRSFRYSGFAGASGSRLAVDDQASHSRACGHFISI